ncbi:class I SAM-dependent methyltransferase [Rhizobium binxianense]
MSIEESIASHYSRSSLERAILDALTASGKDIDHLSAEDLSGADEFHLGWRAATVELAKDLGFEHGFRILDVGSGLGGPARYLAEHYGCQVAGIDLTRDYVDVANALTLRCGLSDLAVFQQGSALALPFGEAEFDGALMVHVGMNIEDKARLFAEVRRVLRPGRLFGVYDIMHAGAGEIVYPVPWAASKATSFVESPDTYRRLISAAGFAIELENDRSAMALALGREMREAAARDGVPPLGLHIVMGPATAERLGNVMGALQAGVIAPVEVIARAI